MRELFGTEYRRPNGEQHEVLIGDIEDSDREWLLDHNITVSFESLPDGNVVVYGDTGLVDPESYREPVEAVVLNNGRSCRATMADLVRNCKVLLRRVGHGAE